MVMGALAGVSPPAQGQSNRDTAIVIAALGADMRSRLGDVPIRVVPGIDTAGTEGFADQRNIAILDPEADAAWTIRLFASAAKGDIGRTFDGLATPPGAIPRIITLGLLRCDMNVCNVLIRVDTPPHGRRNVAESTVWRYTLAQQRGVQKVVGRELRFSAEITGPGKSSRE